LVTKQSGRRNTIAKAIPLNESHQACQKRTALIISKDSSNLKEIAYGSVTSYSSFTCKSSILGKPVGGKKRVFSFVPHCGENTLHSI